MVRKESSILGIDLHEQEIRVVEISVRSNKPTLGKIGRAPMPEGAVVNGRILHTGPVAVALRLLLNSMGVGATAKVIIGVLGDGITLRTMSVPPVPDSELPTIIAGEVNHYGLVHTAGGAYSFLRLNPHSRASNAESRTEQGGVDKRETWLDPEAGDQNPAVVTVVAVEEEVLFSLRETVEQANLTIEAIEPCQYGMFRSVMLAGGPSATLFALMVSPANTDVAFVHKGLIVGYRRIDIGSRLLTLEYSTTTDSPGAPGPTSLGHDPYGNAPVQPAATGSTSGNLNRLAIESLSLEIQRTLNYYQREFPAAAIEEHIFLAVDDVRVEEVARELSLALGVTVEPLRPTLTMQDQEPGADNASALSPIYASAFGLAVHGPGIMGRVPRIDLFSKQRAGVQQKETQRNFRGSIITSLVAIVLGTAGYFGYHKQISALEMETNDTTARTTEIRNKTSAASELRHKQDEQYKALRSEGVAVTEILDYLANSIHAGTGLDAFVVAPDMSLTIRGNSVNEALMIDTYQTLQRSPFIVNPRIVRFGELAPEQGVGVGFEISGKAISEGLIRLPDLNVNPLGGKILPLGGKPGPLGAKPQLPEIRVQPVEGKKK